MPNDVLTPAPRLRSRRLAPLLLVPFVFACACDAPSPETPRDGGVAERDASPAPHDSSPVLDDSSQAPNDASHHDGGTYDGYNPCPPPGTPCVILPFGDSITYGDGSSDHGGYRVPLFRSAHANGESITFHGLMADGPDQVDGVPFPRNHEGHSGYTTTGLLGFSADAIRAYAPHIVLLMVGTNDIAFNEDPANAPTRLGQLMDSITDTDPSLLLIVAQIVPTMSDDVNAAVRAYNAAIPDLVRTRAEAGRHVLMVDMYDALASNPSFASEYMHDMWHPNDAGYQRIAETWYTALAPILR